MMSDSKTIFKFKATVEQLNVDLVQKQLAGHLNIRFTEVTDSTVSAEIKISEIHSRPGGIMSGGTTLALIETVASVAGMMTIDYTKFNIFGIEVNANHLGQVPMGETITAVASPDHVGRTTQIWQVRIHNSKQKLICVGRITLFVAEGGVPGATAKN
jgi:1,4-dihydroxy-2-naphthoyl-CoA hydrolase